MLAGFWLANEPGGCELKVTNLAISGRNVQITILNHGSTDQFITNLAAQLAAGDKR